MRIGTLELQAKPHEEKITSIIDELTGVIRGLLDDYRPGECEYPECSACKKSKTARDEALHILARFTPLKKREYIERCIECPRCETRFRDPDPARDFPPIKCPTCLLLGFSVDIYIELARAT